jgi:type III pantothenate kinase
MTMIILLDVGNTRIKVGWTHRETAQREPVPFAVCHADIGQLSQWLHALPSPVHAAWGVNVAGEIAALAVRDLVLEHTGKAVQWISSRPCAGQVHNKYQVPAQLGADRWVSMVGLAQRASQERFSAAADASTPLMLASFGTATTIDTLGPATPAGHRDFEGGLILPGPQLMRTSLSAGTANLPCASGAAADYPVHTHQAIITGIAAAQSGAVLRQWRTGVERYGRPPRVFSSGGGWDLVKDETQGVLRRAQRDLGLPLEPIEWLSAPVLDGLACLAAHEGQSGVD